MTVLSYGEATNACVTGIHGNARTRKFVIFSLIRGQPHYHFFTISSFLFAQFIFQRPNSMLPFAGTVPNNYYLGKFNGKLNSLNLQIADLALEANEKLQNIATKKIIKKVLNIRSTGLLSKLYLLLK